MAPPGLSARHGKADAPTNRVRSNDRDATNNAQKVNWWSMAARAAGL